METANEGEGDGLARSTTASEQIAGGPQARDSENNDSSFKEDTLDTLQQMLTCETGNTGTGASTPPCDKGTIGQGLHGTSPASDNLDKVKDAISLIQLEACDQAVEADSLERHMELEVTSSDESGDWETASEASVGNEETTEQKQIENLDPNGNMDSDGQDETKDHLKLQLPSGHLNKTGRGGTGQLAEELEQCGERTHSEDPPIKEAFTEGPGPAEESLCNVSKTETEELPPHDHEALREGAVSGESDPNVEEMLSDESVSHFVTTEPQIAELNEEKSVEEPVSGGLHGGKSDLHDEQAVSHLTKIHGKNLSQNEEANDKGIKTKMEEPCTGRPYGGQSGLQDEQMVSQLTREENHCQNEETISKDTETENEEPGIGGPLVEQSGGLHDEQATSQLIVSHEKNGSQNEKPVNKDIRTQIEEPSAGGPHDEEAVNELPGSHEEKGFQNEEPVNKNIKTQMAEPCTGGSHGGLQDEQSVSQLTESLENSSQNEKAVNKAIMTHLEEPCTGGTHVEKSGLHHEEPLGESHKKGSQHEKVINKGIATAVEEPETAGPHVDKSGHHNEEASSELSGSHEESCNKSIKTPMEEMGNKNIELQLDISAGQHAEPQVPESVCEMREPHADKTLPHTEEKVEKCPLPDSDDLVSTETETCVLETLVELCSHQTGEVRDGTGYPDEDADNAPSKPQAGQSTIEVTIVPAETNEPYVEETLVGESGPDIDKSDCEDIHDEACDDDKTRAYIDEIIIEGTLNKAADNGIGENETPTFDTISEETKLMSDHALGSELKEKCIRNVLQEIDQEQGPVGTITSEDDIDSKTEILNNEEVVGTQSAIVHGTGIDQIDIAEDLIENDRSVREKLLDVDMTDRDSNETEDVSVEMVSQEMSSVSKETAGMETKTTSEHSEGANKEDITQGTPGHSVETAIQDISRDYTETDNEGLESPSVSEETCIKHREPAAEDVHIGSRDTLDCETAAIDCNKSLQKILTMDYRDIFSTMKETLECENIEEENEEVFASMVETDILHPMYIVKESHAKENEPEPPEEGKSLNDEEMGSRAPDGDPVLEGESSHTSSGETEDNLEANIRFSEHLLEAISHKTSFEIGVGQELSVDDGISCIAIDSDAGTMNDTSEEVPLDKTMNKHVVEVTLDKAQSLNDSETFAIPGTLIKPIPLRPVVFSNDYFQELDVVSELDESSMKHFVDDGESLDDSHHKDIADSASSSFEETLQPNLQTETMEPQEPQIPGVMHPTIIVGSQNILGFLEEPDQGYIRDTLLANREPFTKPDSDNILEQEAVLTIAAEPILTETALSHEGPLVGDKVKVDSGTKIVQRAAEGAGTDSPPLLITRQRSNTDPGLSCDNSQQDDQHEKEESKARQRTVTPPLDNFTTSFTATSPQMILESKPLEKAQTSIVYPEVNYNISEEQKAEEATPRQNYTFAPTQIFNPLLFIQEGSEEHGFYQDETLSRHKKEGINKRRMPSPPRDTEVLLRGQHPHTISRDSRSPPSSGATVESSATGPTAAHPVTPVWLPPRPLRHTESAGGKDFRPLQPNENPLVRRPTVRHKRGVGGSSGLKRHVMNLPTIQQTVTLGETKSLEGSTRPAGGKGHMSSTTRQRPLPRQMNIREQEDSEPRNRSPMERLAEAEESFRKSTRSPESVLRRGKRPQMEPSTHSIHRRYSTLINSSGLLYQEYSDEALNQEIQRQKPGDSPAEEKDPGSPRLRRRILSSQDSYLQRLSISSADSLWQDLPKIRDSATFMSMSREEQKLQEAKFELIMSEALYLRSLNIAVDHFQRSTELQDVLGNQDRQWLFSRLSEVRDASNEFLFDLEEEFENNMYNFQVCDVVISHEPNFRKVYLPYVTNQSYQDRTFQRLMNNNPRFQQVLSKLESDPVCQRLSLKSFLILPFQRITRLRLLLQNILKRSAPGSHEELQATEAHNAIEKLIRDCNEGVQKMKDTEELILLHQKIQFECKIFPLISASRRLVKHGEVTCLEFNPISFKWKGTTRPVYLHLFSDCLLLSRIREGGRFVVFDHASDVRVERCEIKLHSNQKNIFRVFLRDSAATQTREGYVDGHEMQYIFRTETQSQKLRWIYALSPPKEEIDFLRDGLTQVQCLKSYKARENDELSLEKADILMVTQNSDDGWLCGIRLSDLHSGWFPQCHVQAISRNACLRNLQEEQRLQNARAKLHPTGAK